MSDTVEITSGQPTYEELKAQIEALKAQAKQAKANGALELRVSEKGAISVVGLQRFPVTLYAGQWQRLLSDDNVLAILTFIEEHKDELSWTKPVKEKAEPYTEEQKAADWAIMHRKVVASEDQIAFATQRFNAYNEKRFGSK